MPGADFPRFVTFDCYGTLTDFRITALTRERLASRVGRGRLEALLASYTHYRYDEVLGPWKPYAQVLHDALDRACRQCGVAFDPADAAAAYSAVPTWGPHADVPEGLARLAERTPLVILSNAADAQIGDNVARLAAPFHAVLTAEQAQAYKPRYRAFEYLFDTLGCMPEDILHVSSSLRYDLMTAHDLGVGMRAFVDRGHDVPNPAFGYHRVTTIGEVAALIGA